MQCSRGSKKNFWRRCRGGSRKSKSTIPSTHHNPYISYYIICHLPLVFLSPTSPLPFYSPSLSTLSLSFSICLFLPACFLFACVLACLLVMMAQDNTKLCDFTNTNNNDFISTPIAPLSDTESSEINARSEERRVGKECRSR